MQEDAFVEKVDIPGQSDIFEVLSSKDIQQADAASQQQEDQDELLFTEDNAQLSFIDSDEWWKEHWVGMPEFVQVDATPWKSIYVHFRCYEDLQEFAELIKQRITSDTPSIWHPLMPREKRMHMGYIYES